MKVLCITEDPDRPTIATFLGLHARGVEVTVAEPASEEARATLSAAGIRMVRMSFRKQLDWAMVQRLREELAEQRYDILHVFGNRALQHGLLAARGLPVRLVAYRGIVGNVSFFSPVSWLRFLNPRIDRIVCCCNAVRDYFRTMRPAFLRIPAERAVTIYKGHSLSWYTASPVDLRALGIPSGSFTLACVANYRPRKGIEFLVAALARLPREWPIHLLLIGRMDGPQLTAAIDASPVKERIHRLGHRRDAPAVAAACDAFVLPSIKREGLARSLIEAMSYGVAPIVTDCGGSPEVVVDGVSGLVVPPRDAEALAAAITRLYEDTALRQRLGAAARQRIAEAFRIEDTIGRTFELYCSLVAAPAASPLH